MLSVVAIRDAIRLPSGVLLTCSLTPDTSRLSEFSGPLLLRITTPVDGEVRIEAGSRLLLDTIPGTAPPRGSLQTDLGPETIVIRRAGLAVIIGRNPFSLRLLGPSTSIGFGDTSVGYVVSARWDSPSGQVHDIWLSLNVPSTTLFYGGLPTASRLNNLYANGSELLYLGPEHQIGSPDQNRLPAQPITPVFVTNKGWAMRLSPYRSTFFDLRGRGEIGTLRGSLDVTFTIPSMGRRGEAARLATPSELLAASLRSAWLPPVARGLALDPAISRDSMMNEQFLGALYLRARSLNIPVNILWLEEWRQSPELVFRRAFPGPGDTYGLAALTATTPDPDRHRLAWTGSLAEDYESLRRSLRAALICGLSGFPSVAFDLHAYLGRTGAEPEHPSPDLYRRWTQLLAFSPVMQLHGRRHTHEPWLLPDPTLVAHFRDYAWIHVNLKPYLEATAALAGPGRPMMRAPLLEWPRDTETWNIDDAYLLGQDIYVAPILDANRSVRPIYLPPGRWIDFWNEGELSGGRWLESYPAPPDQIPVFVRAGTLIPFALNGSYVPSAPIADTPRLTLRFFPNPDGVARGEMRRGESLLAASLSTSPRRARVVRVTRTREPVTFWIPEPTAAPRRVTVAGVTVPRKDSWQDLDRGPGWLWDPELQRLMVRLMPGPARSITID